MGFTNIAKMTLHAYKTFMNWKWLDCYFAHVINSALSAWNNHCICTKINLWEESLLILWVGLLVGFHSKNTWDGNTFKTSYLLHAWTLNQRLQRMVTQIEYHAKRVTTIRKLSSGGSVYQPRALYVTITMGFTLPIQNVQLDIMKGCWQLK